jgi:hypothetical protein
MRKVFLYIMVVFMSCAPIVHGVLAYHFNAVQTLLPEEETKEDISHKPFKTDIKESFSLHGALHFDLEGSLISKALAQNNYHYPKGFPLKPYLPPKV